MSEMKLSEFLAEHKASEFGLAPVSKAMAVKMAEKIEADNTALRKLNDASIELYCGVISKTEWRIAVRNSPKGQELIALAAEDDLDKLTTQQKPTEEAMEEA